MLKGVLEVAVVVTSIMAVERGIPPFFKALVQLLTLVNLGLVAAISQAGVLPTDSVDMLYHSYDGGGMKINGPFVLVRKSIGNQVSVNGHYYVDSVSAASIDVIASASKYTEKRTELSGGIDYLHDSTIISAGYTNSKENDFLANTVFLAVNQDFFGDLSTLSMSYTSGWDEVSKVQSEFKRKVKRQNFKVGLSQVITKNTLMGLDVETITDQGFLNNPYRRYRFFDSTASAGFSYADEVYPKTHTSTAVAFRTLYYLPYRASIKGEYRYFTDSWGINANTFELLYVHPIGKQWTLEGKLRYYKQSKADFYQDIFSHQGAQTYLGRDKELSSYSDTTIGAGVTYELGRGFISHIDKMKFTLLADYLQFKYDNFRDVTQKGFAAGNEPLFKFNAWVTRASIILEY